MKFWHIGILTPSIEKTLDTLCAIPGVTRSAWTINEIEFSPSEMIVGKGGRLRTAMGRVSGIVYELIEPMDEHSYHAAELQRKGPGLHHAAYVCEGNQDAIVESYKASGSQMVWEAQHGTEHVCYMEAADGSTIWEFINTLPFMPED